VFYTINAERNRSIKFMVLYVRHVDLVVGHSDFIQYSITCAKVHTHRYQTQNIKYCSVVKNNKFENFKTCRILPDLHCTFSFFCSLLSADYIIS
jgi:hypothetical protein